MTHHIIEIAGLAWPFRLIEQKGVTFDYDFSLPFLFPLKKRGKKKKGKYSKNRDRKSGLSARSFRFHSQNIGVINSFCLL